MQTKDKGVEFALNNLENALKLAKQNPSFDHLVRIINRERIRLKDIKKTGDLINYYDAFSFGKHQHALDFYYFELETKGAYIPSEKMSDNLRTLFKEEAENVTRPEDFCIGDKFSNDYLSVVLGGNYAMSFRFCRDSNYAYIMMNSNITGVDSWEDGFNQLLFAPPGRFYREGPTINRLFEKCRYKKILVFEKSDGILFTFFGFYEMKGIEGSRIRLARVNGENDKRTKKLSSAPILKERDLSNETDLDAHLVIADALMQKADENGVEFIVHKTVLENRKYYILKISFPSGFFELFHSFEPKTLFLFEKDSALKLQRVENVEYMHPNSFLSNADKGITGWSIIENELDNYQKVYYNQLSNSANGKTWHSSGPFIKPKLIKRQHIVPLSRFIVYAIIEDFYSSLAKGNRTNDEFAGINPSQVSEEYQFLLKSADLEISGYYSRIEIDSPIFSIKSNNEGKTINARADKEIRDIEKLVFVSFDHEKNRVINIKGKNYLDLGTNYVSQMARLYPEIYAQYVISDDVEEKKKEIDSSDSVVSSKSHVRTEKEYDQALKNNFERFKDLIDDGEKSFAIITGNGVSIPFGAENWKTLSQNILSQLTPRFIDSCNEIENFFGDLSLLTADFSLDTLTEKGEQKLYWSALKYSVYRRYSDLLFNDESVLKSVAFVKKRFGKRLSLYTYNYDTFLEDQYNHDYSEDGLVPVVSRIDDEDSNNVVHLHGIFKKEDSEGIDIVLTRSEYQDAYKKPIKRAGLSEFSRDLKEKVCLFVGSSMTDMFQMMMIDEACKNNRDINKNLIYALMPTDKLNTKSKEAVYKYFLRKHIYIIPFKEFDELPKMIKQLFKLDL